MRDTDTQALIRVDRGEPLTTSRLVAERFGRRHGDVLRSIQRLIDELETAFTQRNFALSDYTDQTGRTLPEYLLTQSGFALVAMGFTGKEATRLKARFIAAFDAMAKELQRLKAQRVAPDWQAARAAVAQQHSSVNTVLVEMRRAAGKATEPHHLANEARLIGHALTGVFAGLDRNTLDAAQLKTLHKVECRDVILLAQGADYERRKAELRALVLEEQAKEQALQLDHHP